MTATPTRSDTLSRPSCQNPSSPLPRPLRSRLVIVVIGLLPTIEDELHADLVEQLALALVARDEELLAVRAVQSEALEALHRTARDNRLLRRRLAEMRRTA